MFFRSPTSSPPQSFRSANSQRRPSDTSTSTDDDTFHSLAPSSPSNASTTNTVILRPPDRSSLVDTTTNPAPYSLTTTSFGQGDDSSLQSSASTHSGYRMGYHSGPVPEWPLGDNEPTRPAAPGFKYDATTATNDDTTTATGPSASAGSTHTDETCNSQDGRATNTTPQEEERFSTRRSAEILSVDTTGIPVTTMSTGSTIADGRDEPRVIRLPVPPDTPPTENSKWNCFSDCFSRQE